MIFAALVPTAALRAASVNLWPLDDRAAYAIRLSPDAPTTIAFPSAVTALEGANVSARAEDNPAVLLSHQPGASFFSLRALRPAATGAINAIYHGKVIVLTFTTGGDPHRAITFRESTARPLTVRQSEASPTHWLNLLDQAKRYALIADQYPALAQRVERKAPGTVNECGGFTAIFEEAFRFTAEDTLVFRLRLENQTGQPVRYATTRLAVRVGLRSFPVALAEADGLIPAKSATTVWLVVGSSSDGAGLGLSLSNSFSVDVPRLP